MNSPHSKQLKYSTISTEPLLVKLLERVDQHQLSAEEAANQRQGHVHMEPRRRATSEIRGKNPWSSQFISLTDMAGWMAASPWYKWKMKGRFPMKLFLHIAIAFLSLFQIVFLSTNTGRVIRNTKTLVDELLFPASSPVFNLTSLITATNETICRTCAYEQDSLTKFILNQPFRLQLEELKDGGQIYNGSMPNFSMQTETKEYLLNCSLCPYHLLDHTDLDASAMTDKQRQRLRHSLTVLSIHFGMEQFTFLEKGRYCLDWSIDLIYDLTLRRGDLVKPLIKKRADGCGHWPTEPMNIPLVWVNIWLLLFSCLSFLLIMRQLGRQVLLYSTVKKEIKNIEMKSTRDVRMTFDTWSNIAKKKKIKFFSIWPFFTLGTNLAQILGSSILISHRGKSGNMFITSIIGLAASGALLNMVSKSPSLFCSCVCVWSLVLLWRLLLLLYFPFLHLASTSTDVKSNS